MIVNTRNRKIISFILRSQINASVRVVQKKFTSEMSKTEKNKIKQFPYLMIDIPVETFYLSVNTYSHIF